MPCQAGGSMVAPTPPVYSPDLLVDLLTTNVLGHVTSIGGDARHAYRVGQFRRRAYPDELAERLLQGAQPARAAPGGHLGRRPDEPLALYWSRHEVAARPLAGMNPFMTPASAIDGTHRGIITSSTTSTRWSSSPSSPTSEPGSDARTRDAGRLSAGPRRSPRPTGVVR